MRNHNDLRLAGFVGTRTKTYHNFWSGVQKSVARWKLDGESRIRLPHQLTANYFACLVKMFFLREDYEIGPQKLTLLAFPKYQNSPFKVAPQPL